MSVTEQQRDELVERLFAAGHEVSVLPIEHDFLRFYRLDR
jgi:hypothetical protein